MSNNSDNNGAPILTLLSAGYRFASEGERATNKAGQTLAAAVLYQHSLDISTAGQPPSLADMARSSAATTSYCNKMLILGGDEAPKLEKGQDRTESFARDMAAYRSRQQAMRRAVGLACALGMAGVEPSM